MQHVILQLESINVGKRQRTLDPATEAHIEELVEDIKENGLIHAPTISYNGSEGVSLTAGWCRLQALKRLTEPYYYGGATIAPGFVPCVPSHFTEKKDLFRIELMENLRRKNLSPVDEAKAISELHRYMQAEEGAAWSKARTGQFVDEMRMESRTSMTGLIRTPERAAQAVTDAMLIETMGDDPDVLKAKTRKEAVSIARKKLERQLMQGLGALQTHRQSDYHLLNADCREILVSMAPSSFNGIICDPPYGIEADTFGEQAPKAGGHGYEDSAEYAASVAQAILYEGFRICKADAHLYMFCDIRFWEELSEAAERCGWNPYSTPLIWHKPGFGHAPQPGYFTRRYETILFAQKGTRKLSKTRSDVFEYAPVKDKIVAAQKPVELYKELIALSFFPGEYVLDPTAGCGTIFHAAKANKVKATGIEKDPEVFSIALQACNA